MPTADELRKDLDLNTGPIAPTAVGASVVATAALLLDTDLVRVATALERLADSQDKRLAAETAHARGGPPRRRPQPPVTQFGGPETSSADMRP